MYSLIFMQVLDFSLHQHSWYDCLGRQSLTE